MKGYVTSIKPCIGAVKVFTHHATREGAGQIQRKAAGQIQPKAKKQKSKKAKKQKSKKAKKQKAKSIDPQMLIFMYGLFLTRWAYHHTLLRKDASLVVVSTGSLPEWQKLKALYSNITINMRTK